MSNLTVSIKDLKEVKEKDVDVKQFDTWIIVVCFLVFWPLGLVFLVLNLSGSTKKKQGLEFIYNNGCKVVAPFKNLEHRNKIMMQLSAQGIEVKQC